MTNRGLRINLPRTAEYVNGELQILARFRVKPSTETTTDSRSCAVITLEKIGPDRYHRKSGTKVLTVVNPEFWDVYTHRMYIDAENWLKYTTTSSRVPCPMRTTSLYCEFGSFEVHGVALHREERLQSWPEEGKQLDLQQLGIFDNEWASISFSVQYMFFTITIGQHQRKAGLLVTHRASAQPIMDYQVWAIIVHMKYQLQQQHNQYACVYRSWCLGPNLLVDLRARKSRTVESGPHWTVAIEFLDGKWGVPTGDMAVIEGQLRLAGV